MRIEKHESMKFPLSADAQHWTPRPVIALGHGLLRVCVIVLPGFLQCAHFRAAQRHSAHASH